MKHVRKAWASALSTELKPVGVYLLRSWGPVLVGIELIRSPVNDSYSPYFVLFDTWSGGGLKQTLSDPCMHSWFKTLKGLSVNIKLNDSIDPRSILEHSVSLYSEIPAGKPFSLIELFDLARKYASSQPLSAAPNSFHQARLRQFRMEAAICVNEMDVAQDELTQILAHEWDDWHFNLSNKTVEAWFSELKNTLLQPEIIRNRSNQCLHEFGA